MTTDSLMRQLAEQRLGMNRVRLNLDGVQRVIKLANNDVQLRKYQEWETSLTLTYEFYATKARNYAGRLIAKGCWTRSMEGI